MADLVQKLMASELSEAEWDALIRKVGASESLALGLAAIAEAAYLGYGLPVPKWSGGSLGSHSAAAAKGAGIKGAAAKGAAIAAKGAVGLGLKILGAAAATAMLATGVKVAVSHFGLPAPAPAVQAPPPHQAAPAPAAAAPAPRQARPVPVAEAVGDLLSIQVSMEHSELARVRVEDSSGRVVRELYNGILRQGDWALRWDGKLEGGGAAEPGSYRIVLEAKGAKQIRKVEIR